MDTPRARDSKHALYRGGDTLREASAGLSVAWISTAFPLNTLVSRFPFSVCTVFETPAGLLACLALTYVRGPPFAPSVTPGRPALTRVIYLPCSDGLLCMSYCACRCVAT